METRKIRFTFAEEVLGSANNDPEIFDNYQRDKQIDEMVKASREAYEADPKRAPKPLTKREAKKRIDEEREGIEADPETKMTVFNRTAAGEPCLYDYHVKGAFKECCAMLKRVPGTRSAGPSMRAYKKVIDGLIFPAPREIVIHMPEGAEVGTCQRPLRASTPQGERIALACSETCPAGSYIDFSVTCLDPSHWLVVEEWLDYLQLHGIGQWRNSGKGRGRWEYAG